MTRPTFCQKRYDPEEAVSTIVEYINITAVLIAMFVLVMLVTNALLIEGPSDTLKYHSFTDIGNGVSTRIVDIYVISPENGRIMTKFDLPDDVAEKEYNVKLDPLQTGASQRIIVTDGNTKSIISIGGIGATRAVTGNTTGSGINRITYDSGGV
ncbi:hypothetical protein F1737_08525 [Methanoplanus sp. FWC-SCC4]|uniref:Uncharacterized protein n=1 Tax=Methanochimaera problematica TaxID=2609417 RepID=A0AA97FFX6_9EURY|nr:hypothetical protein [Methanoplanus sp. FWC-SCC4]WOF16731.1 hypothetical protein F1737_08525 [Methanoplanus sp. FWC-SCC4]